MIHRTKMALVGSLVASLVVCLAASPAVADLAAFTGNSYGWTSYNDVTSGSPFGGTAHDMALNQNGHYVTDFGIDTDYGGGSGTGCWLWSQNTYTSGNKAGDMVDYDTGSVTTTMTWDLVNPQSGNNMWNSSTGKASSGHRDVVFGDTLGTFTGAGYGSNRSEQHNPSFVAGRGSSLTFAGLDDGKTYDFVAEASSNRHDLGDMNYHVEIGSGWANESVVTTTATGYSAGMTSVWADDLVAFTGITPVGGVIEIQFLSIGTQGASPGGQNRGNDLSVGAFALGAQAGGGGGGGAGGAVPEPASILMLGLGGLGLLIAQRRRRS
jgi:hypothetical protein